MRKNSSNPPNPGFHCFPLDENNIIVGRKLSFALDGRVPFARQIENRDPLTFVSQKVLKFYCEGRVDTFGSMPANGFPGRFLTVESRLKWANARAV